MLAYKVQYALKSAMARMAEASSQKLAKAILKARYLVWSLLIQALLNDEKLAAYLDEYGTSLRREADFRDLVAKLGTSRVLPLLKEVLSDQKYQARMAEERYDFLRSKELFTRCKRLAYERQHWTMQRL